jgi:hypothetical protein
VTERTPAWDSSVNSAHERGLVRRREDHDRPVAVDEIGFLKIW